VKALARAVDLLNQYANGMVASPVFDIYPAPITPAIVNITLSTISEKTGVKFTSERIEKILGALQMGFKKSNTDEWEVSIPTNKPDVLRDVDVIEEILRIHGFINVALPQKMHTSVAIESKENPHRFRTIIGNFLASNGYLECMNMSLTSPAYYKDIPWSKPEQWVTIHNTSNESLNLMRPEMIIPTLETIKRNVNRKQEDLKLFEFGKSYGQENGNPFEQEHLIVVVMGKQTPASWLSTSPRALDYFALKEIVLALFNRLGIKWSKLENINDDNGFAFGINYYSNDNALVRMGGVDMKLTGSFDIRQQVYIADFNLANLIQASISSNVIYEELNRFPAVIRDLAIVVDQTTAFERVRDVVQSSGGSWLTDLEVFDIYKNAEHVGEGKMSMALRFTIENKEATLADKEIEQWFGNVQKALVKNVGAEIRK
jgi:phenylalanyl-tRNA synthetase beta chain